MAIGSELKPGDVVGGVYTVDEAGPQGGMARIWRAWHRGLRTWHGLKILDDQYAEDDDVRARFLEEARIQAWYTHPHIVRVTDVLYEDRRLVLVMDWLSGGDLEAHLEEHSVVPIHQALVWTRQLLEALQHVHHHGVVHRDIKPSNLLLDDRGRLRLTDFGVARVEDGRRTLAGVRIGTPDYMSPEQLRDPAQVDGRSDLFSVGAVLYEMLTGRVATRQEDLLGAGLETLPLPLVRLLRMALAPAPDDRFPDAETFLAALSSAQAPTVLVEEDTEAVGVAHALPPPPSPPWRAPSRLLYLVLGAGLTAVGAWGWLGDDDGDGLGRFADACPLSAEDIDGWQDADGCPEEDNDGDDIPDVVDECPNEAEDLDGAEDEDGCPDEDDDRDGVTDRNDGCPETAEDLDGFSDGDGCPDEDNDNDHFLDADDQCPDRPELDDGFLDGDGCPDPALAVGDLHSCVLTWRGEVTCWGSDDESRGGTRPGGFVQIDADADHTCGLTGSGDLQCWGNNDGGEAPKMVTGPISSFDTGRHNTCAIVADQRVRCWGSPGRIIDEVPDDNGYVSVAVGLEHACALSRSGKVRCWGEIADTPTSEFVQIAAGGWHSCGIRRGGRLFCWGFDGDGQLNAPGGQFVDLSLGRWHSCGVRADGLLFCWGFDGDGQAPTVLPGDFHEVRVGQRHGCGLLTSGEVRCWGEDGRGQTRPPNARGLFFPG
ncbi:MAG: protein kinase [Myxococcota bacterium]